MARKSLQEKYPETSTFHFFNQNPKNRITEDCVARAVSRVLDQDYGTTILEMAQIQITTGYSYLGNKGISLYMESKGWTKHKQPRKADNTKYTGKQFCKTFKPTRVLANIGGNHIVAIIDGKVNDIWDSTDGCIGNYWTKED